MMSEMDVNAIAGTLKLYFRELPEPLFTDEFYPNFAEGIGEHGRSPPPPRSVFPSKLCRWWGTENLTGPRRPLPIPQGLPLSPSLQVSQEGKAAGTTVDAPGCGVLEAPSSSLECPPCSSHPGTRGDEGAARAPKTPAPPSLCFLPCSASRALGSSKQEVGMAKPARRAALLPLVPGVPFSPLRCRKGTHPGVVTGGQCLWVRMVMGLDCPVPSDTGPRRGLQLGCDPENNTPPDPPQLCQTLLQRRAACSTCCCHSQRPIC